MRDKIKLGGKKVRKGSRRKPNQVQVNFEEGLGEDEGIAQIIKHNGGTPPRFKGLVLSKNMDGAEIQLVKMGSKYPFIHLDDIVFFQRNTANSLTRDKQEYLILSLLNKKHVSEAKRSGAITSEKRNRLGIEEDEDIVFDDSGQKIEVSPQQRRYSISSSEDEEEEIDDL